MSTIYDIWFSKLNLTNCIKKQIIEKVMELEKSQSKAEFAKNKVDLLKKFYYYSRDVYKQIGLTEKAIDKIEASKNKLDECDKILTEAQNNNIFVLGYFDEDYPRLLREIPDPPIVLYGRGDVKHLNKVMIGMIGSRKCTEWGYRTALRVSEELANSGIVVTSGMALGVDGVSHKGALKAGPSVGVLGSGVDICYPSSNKNIYSNLIENGCIISEYEAGTLPRAYHFPARNRIIAGLCYELVIIEAQNKSGSLITANLALEYGREVCAMVGNENSKLSEGTLELIDAGAARVTSAIDIINELPYSVASSINFNKKIDIELAQAESIVYAYVSHEPIFMLDLETLVKQTSNAGDSINRSLVALESKGLIKRLPGERYVRI